MKKSHIGFIVAFAVVAQLIVVLGALAKLEHWASASLLLISGMILQALSFVGIGYLIYRFFIKKNDALLNDK
jgi:hypothetical protein